MKDTVYDPPCDVLVMDSEDDMKRFELNEEDLKKIKNEE